jgi:hypothetical protein
VLAGLNCGELVVQRGFMLPGGAVLPGGAFPTMGLSRLLRLAPRECEVHPGCRADLPVTGYGSLQWVNPGKKTPASKPTLLGLFMY